MRKAIVLFLIFILLCPHFSWASTSDLVISEIMYDLDGSDSGREWVEIYNSGPEAVEVLTGSGANTWRFFDGSNHIINLVQGEALIQASQYFIIASDAQNFLSEHQGFAGTVFDTVMSLSNSSSTIALSFDGGQNQGPSASYDSAWGASGNGQTLEKINLVQDSSQNNWQESFVLGGSPGATSTQGSELPPIDDGGGDGGDDEPEEDNDGEDTPEQNQPPENNSARTQGNYWSQIKISEILPNPTGSDSAEWIELFNQGGNTVDLSGFKLQDNSASQYTIGQGLMLAGNSYLVLYKNQSKISLNNAGGDSLQIYAPDSTLIDGLSYESAPEGKSYALIDGAFAWTTSPTPGQANVLPANQAPQAVIKIEGENFFTNTKIIFSGGDSLDPEEGELKYVWDFGDSQSGDEVKENHTYEKPGNYLVKLIVTDPGGSSSEATKNIVVENQKVDLKLNDIKPIDFSKEELLLSEFVPNPLGSDDNEWVEIYNKSNKEIDLAGWQIDDQEGGSQPYIFSTSTIILPGNFLVIDRSVSQITLNNSEDSVRLLTPLVEIWQEVKYQKIPEGNSFAWDIENKEWSISDDLTPGQANVMSVEAANIEIAEDFEYKKGEIGNITATIWGQNSKTLYLLDANGFFIEVYGQIDFARYKRGDNVVLFGKITRVDPWLRIKINNDQEISIIASDQEIARPETMESSDVAEEHNGQLVVVRGMVVKKSGKNIYLADDLDQEYSVRLSLKFDTKELKIEKGLEIIASGLLQVNEKGTRLDVFDKTDLQMEKKVLGEKISTSTNSTSVVEVNGGYSQGKKILKFVLLGFLLISIFYVLATKLKKKK